MSSLDINEVRYITSTCPSVDSFHEISEDKQTTFDFSVVDVDFFFPRSQNGHA